MFNNVALDVFIGLIAVYLLYSLLASILMEVVAKFMGLRARMTQKAISKLLDDSEFTDAGVLQRSLKSIFSTRFINNFNGRPLTALFYSHPNIKNLGRNNFNRKPSDISPELFSETFIQILRGDKFFGQQNQVDLISTNLKSVSDDAFKLPEWYLKEKKKLWAKHISPHQIYNNQKAKQTSQLRLFSLYVKKRRNFLILYFAQIGSSTQRKKLLPEEKETLKINDLTSYQLNQFIFDSHSDITVFKTKLMDWYTEMMDRATGWYIKQTRILLFIIGIILALVFNIDTIAISAKLSKDKTARDKMIDFATKIRNNPPSVYSKPFDNLSDTAIRKAFDQANQSITETNQILGNNIRFYNDITILSIVGWVITGFAISLGAPFWFDLLGKIMSIRQAGGNSTQKERKSNSQINNRISPKDRIG